MAALHLGAGNTSGTSLLDEQYKDIIIQVQQTMLEGSTRVYLQKMKIQGNRFEDEDEHSNKPFEDAREEVETLHDVPPQLLRVRHHTSHGIPPRKSYLCHIVDHHGVGDGLYHLKNVGGMSKLHRHDMIKPKGPRNSKGAGSDEDLKTPSQTSRGCPWHIRSRVWCSERWERRLSFFPYGCPTAQGALVGLQIEKPGPYVSRPALNGAPV
ncbi:hypothetical protein Cgig2_028759 [Carnegiea gigantea]|uniref:Uncharacterized protein n=1 Tax=Carnegiea gigantea TaxID=171969 RepID=A0A9Q1JQL6_9CARY|nr:hypothetical protein Cgig2_028759 [Carnegiea gigantea]